MLCIGGLFTCAEGLHLVMLVRTAHNHPSREDVMEHSSPCLHQVNTQCTHRHAQPFNSFSKILPRQLLTMLCPIRETS